MSRPPASVDMVWQELGRHPSDWAGKTAPEIREIAAEDGSVLVIPVASIEQHGNHLPVSTDTILVDAVAHAGAERVTGDGADDVPLLIAPPFWAGYSPHHAPFGGTLTLDFETMRAALADVVAAGLDNGFDAVLVLNGHGGNVSLVDAVVKTVGETDPEATVAGLTYFQLAGEWVDEVRDSDPGGMNHGGEFETSLMLHLRPDLVREDRVEGTTHEREYTDEGVDLHVGGPLSIHRFYDEKADSGALGDPSLGTAEKGEEMYERLGEDVERVFRELHEHNR